MIGLKECVGDDFPVDAPPQHARLVMMIGGETVGGEIALESGEAALDIESQAGRGTDPDHAAFLDNRELAQAARRFVHIGERTLVGARQQLAIEAIAPAVISAGEVARAFAGPVGQPRPAMAAYVEK